ncbi:MAG: FAD-binding protein, partial [Gordonia polyisoprenivorans]|nr:FAD-binding protein [Gordonia polyisoprenivorans]
MTTTINQVAAFRAGVPGALVAAPGDAEYGAAVGVWNAAVSARPTLVVRPRSAEQVASTVAIAREVGLEVSVRGGGHDWLGRSLRDRGVVIDLADMRDVR